MVRFRPMTSMLPIYQDLRLLQWSCWYKTCKSEVRWDGLCLRCHLRFCKYHHKPKKHHCKGPRLLTIRKDKLRMELLNKWPKKLLDATKDKSRQTLEGTELSIQEFKEILSEPCLHTIPKDKLRMEMVDKWIKKHFYAPEDKSGQALKGTELSTEELEAILSEP